MQITECKDHMAVYGSKAEVLRQAAKWAGKTQKAVKEVWKAAESQNFTWEEIETQNNKLLVVGRWSMNSRENRYFASLEK